MVTEQKSTNPWISMPYALTQPNPGYGHSDRAEVCQPINWCALCHNLHNLNLDIVSKTEQKSTNPWISVPCALT